MEEEQKIRELQQQQQQQQQQLKKPANNSEAKKTLDASIQTNKVDSSPPPPIQQSEAVHNSKQSNGLFNPMIKPPRFMIQQQAQMANPPHLYQHDEDDYVETSFICNIPEHHKLEDIVHQNREQIANLKYYIYNIKLTNNIDEIALLEKKAEIEALDLAINDRKSQLISIELSKNRKLYDNSSTSESSGNQSRISSDRTSSEVSVI